jgi:hypothetical protein
VTVWERIASRLEERTVETVKNTAPPVRRGKVTKATPLTVELADGDILTRGDEDVEVDNALITTPPAVGDLVRVHTDEHGDYLISGVIKVG